MNGRSARDSHHIGRYALAVWRTNLPLTGEAETRREESQSNRRKDSARPTKCVSLWISQNVPNNTAPEKIPLRQVSPMRDSAPIESAPQETGRARDIGHLVFKTPGTTVRPASVCGNSR